MTIRQSGILIVALLLGLTGRAYAAPCIQPIGVCDDTSCGPADCRQWDTLWSSPNGYSAIVDQCQTRTFPPNFNGFTQWFGMPPAEKPIGQTFRPEQSTLSRIDVVLKNTRDLAPITVRLYKWYDANMDCVEDDGEYAATIDVSNGLLIWSDTITLPGPDDWVMVPMFPNLSGLSTTTCIPGVSETSHSIHFLQFSTEPIDGNAPHGEWGLAGMDASGGADRYPGGKARVNDWFGNGCGDIWFKTYSGDGGALPLPPFSPSPFAGWEAPSTTGPTVISDDLLELIEDRAVDMSGMAHSEQALVHAFLHAAGEPGHLSPAQAQFTAAIIDRCNTPPTNPIFDFQLLEFFGWAYKWIEADLDGATKAKFRKYLLHSAYRLYPNREAAMYNRTLATALGMKLVTDLVLASEFSTLSGSGQSFPECDTVQGWFDEVLDSSDRDDWIAYASGVWTEFKSHWDLAEDASHYEALDQRVLLQLIDLYETDKTAFWNTAGWKGFVERMYQKHSVMGPSAVYGDSSGLNLDWGAPMWFFSQAGVRLGDARYNALAFRIYDYHRTHIHLGPAGLHDRVFSEWNSFAHAYFAGNTLTNVTPPAQVEQASVAQLSEGTQFSSSNTKLGQTFTAVASPLVRLDLKLDRQNSSVNATLKIYSWDTNYTTTIAGTPLYQKDFSVAGTGNQLYTFRPFLSDSETPSTPPGGGDFVKSQTYLFEVTRNTAFRMPGANSSPYAGGGLIQNTQQPHASKDLWFKAYDLTPNGSTYTTHKLTVAMPPSQQGVPPVFYRFVTPAVQVPDKLVLRSGYNTFDLHAIVNLTVSPRNHGHNETGAVLSLVDKGSILLTDSARVDKQPKDGSMPTSRRFGGGVVSAEIPDRSTVRRFADARSATVAWIDWPDTSGWDLDWQRRFYFVKNRFLLVRDRALFKSPMHAKVGVLWHATDMHEDKGTDWFNLYANPPLGLQDQSDGEFSENDWWFKNVERYLLLKTPIRSASGYSSPLPYFDPDPAGNPITPAQIVAMDWTGTSGAFTERWFDSLLYPHNTSPTPSAGAAHVEVINSVIVSDERRTAFKVTVGPELIFPEIWYIVDNPGQLQFTAGGITTDAGYFIAKTMNGQLQYLLTYQATNVSVSDGLVNFSRSWGTVRTSVEE